MDSIGKNLDDGLSALIADISATNERIDELSSEFNDRAKDLADWIRETREYAELPSITLTKRIDELTERVNIDAQDLHAFNVRIDELEAKLERINKRVHGLETNIAIMDERIEDNRPQHPKP